MKVDKHTQGTLLTVVGVFGLGAILAAAVWFTPGSPAVLWRADAAAAQGSSATALTLYDDVAQSGWWVSLRERALRRSATLLSTELADPGRASERLEVLLALSTDPSARARIRTRQAHLHLAQRDVDAAARSFLSAFSADPESPAAGQRLVLAARTFGEAGQAEQADRLWNEVADRFAGHRATARLAQARVALTDGRTERALALFDQALSSSRGPDVAAAARLGIASSLERLGNLDEAIAEIDQVDLPGDVRDRRLDGLMNRRDLRRGTQDE
ncbi:MAG: tetratricopeptide repeat protein [Myxococcota bacterium]